MITRNERGRLVHIRVACKASELTDVLEESVRVDIHRQLDEVCRWGGRCEFVPTERAS